MIARLRTTSWPVLCALALAACGATPRPDDTTDDTTDTTPKPPVVPDPGTKPLGFNWQDVEPNDTPETATPLGVAAEAQVFTWVDGNQLGGTDKADFFVFRSGAQAGTFNSNTCWSGGTNFIDMYLYKVVDGQPLTQLFAGKDTATSCEQTTAGVALEPNTKYLLELRNVDGAGTYFS